MHEVRVCFLIFLIPCQNLLFPRTANIQHDNVEVNPDKVLEKSVHVLKFQHCQEPKIVSNANFFTFQPFV